MEWIQLEWFVLQRMCVGLFGLLLLVSGTRLYRYSILIPGAGIGAYIGVVLTMGQTESIQMLGVGFCAVVGVVTMLLVEKLAIAILCALLGGALTQYGVPYYLGIPTEWYWVIVGSVIGGMFFTPIFPRLLPLWMSMLGAGCVNWAMHQPRNLEWFVGLTLLGTLIQLFFGAQVRDMEEP
jgi:hypothetical protein